MLYRFVFTKNGHPYDNIGNTFEINGKQYVTIIIMVNYDMSIIYHLYKNGNMKL
jgi:hypothetical protein